MSKKLDKVLASLKTAVGSLQGNNGSHNGNNRRRRRRRGNANRSVPHPVGIMAGYGSAISSTFHQAMRGDGLVVRGLDLLTTLFVPDVKDDTHLSFYMNANPANWYGTRIGAISRGFQNYRPLKFTIHYRPQVGSTDNRSIFIGTLWQGNMLYGSGAIEPSLLTSPGGTYLPSWQSCSSVVPLGSRLPMRMFPIRDPPQVAVPFSLLVRSSDGGPSATASDMPGRIFIEYEYEFRNAIGAAASTLPTEGAAAATVNRVRLQVFNIKTSDKSQVVARWVLSQDPAITTNAAISGVVVDVSGGPTDNFPIGSHISTDFAQGVIGDGAGQARFIQVVKINDELPAVGSLAEGSEAILYIAGEFGDPVSPVPPLPTSSSSSSSVSRRLL